MKFQFTLAFIYPLFISLCTASPPAKFPEVDLGYARHIPTYVGNTSNNISYAIYRNIRFAKPPTGDLRFRAPVTPPPAAEGVQDGIVPRNSTDCVQTWPTWLTSPPGMNGSTWGSEDCLFLDVFVPEGLPAPTPAGVGVPVLHWVYGGGYFFGAKDWAGNPAGLLDTMRADEKFIIVASNYRLGPFGWMSSNMEPSIDPNIGLQDTWAALQWTKSYAHRFGGNSEKVTAMGQSAGAGQIQHILSADALGNRHAPFYQAILSSPGYRPHIDRSEEMAEIYDLFLKATDCVNAACLRGLSEEKLKEANAYMMLDAPPGEFGGPSIGFGPIIDGDIVVDLPDRILSEEHAYHKSQIKRIFGGGMSNEGMAGNTTWDKLVANFARTPTQETIRSIREAYINGSHGSALSPQNKFYGDIVFTCHEYFTNKHWSSENGANGREAYKYEISIPPAAHGQDVGYYFFDKNVKAMDPTVVKEVARKFQINLRQFILGQKPQDWPEYSSGGAMGAAWVNITAGGLQSVVGEDETVLAKRCEMMLGLFDKEEDGW